MNSAVCTLFENHYHFGVAALTNSLHRNGFRGSVYAGYRGNLPNWTAAAVENPSLLWPGGRSLEVSDGVSIHFLPIETEYHLTNYKPNFMIRLWEGHAKDAEAIAYFDPDITVKCNWNFFDTWMSHGVALVHEITSNDMPQTHPLRKEWEKVIFACNRKSVREINSYISGGFCGVHNNYKEFLYIWKEIFDTGIRQFNLTPDQWSHEYDRTYIFYRQDQDALNITAMCSKVPISEMGPDGMDFIHGGWTMSHAVGAPKPWRNLFFISALNGRPPSLADKAYWSNVYSPIKCHNSIKVYFKKLSILLSAFIGRFYSRK